MYVSAPSARNGPNGINVVRVVLPMVSNPIPMMEPIKQPINKLNQTPIMPVNAPINARIS